MSSALKSTVLALVVSSSTATIFDGCQIFDFSQDMDGRYRNRNYIESINAAIPITLDLESASRCEGRGGRVLDTNFVFRIRNEATTSGDTGIFGLAWPNENCGVTEGIDENYGIGSAGEPDANGDGGNCGGDPLGNNLGNVIIIQDDAEGCSGGVDTLDAYAPGGTFSFGFPEFTNFGIVGILNAGKNCS